MDSEQKLPVAAFHGARELLPDGAHLTGAHALPRQPFFALGRVHLRSVADVDEVDADVAVSDAQLLHGQELAGSGGVQLERV